MLPANNVGAAANQTQTKRDLQPLTISPMKLAGNISCMPTTLTMSTPASAPVTSPAATPAPAPAPSPANINGHQQSQKAQEELRYLPIATMPTKPCNVTISSYANNNNNHKSNNLNKLTPMNIVQKPLKNNSNNKNTNAAPIIQLMTANPNVNANSLLSILTPKTIVNHSNNIINSSKTQSPLQLQSQSQSLPQSQSQPVLIRPATTLTTIQAQQQNGAVIYNNNNKYGKGTAAAAVTLVTAAAAAAAPKANAAAAASNKTARIATKTVGSSTAQISLVSKSRAPVILSKAAVEKIRFKIGQVQKNSNPGALILAKTLSNLNAKPAPETQADQKKCVPMASATPILATPNPIAMPTPLLSPKPTTMVTAMPMSMPTPMPLPLPTNASTNVVLPELKISSLNGAKIMKVAGGTLAVVMPPLAPAPPAAVPAPPAAVPVAAAAVPVAAAAQMSPTKLQRSKSLAGNNENEATQATSMPNNATERRHSVAIMSKEVDVVEQTKPIETITIDDDDSEEEREREREQELLVKQNQELKSRKSSTASRSSIASVASSSRSRTSSSSVEMILMPSIKPDELDMPKMSIVKAETLPVSKEEFEKSLHCAEQVDQISPPNRAAAAAAAAKSNRTATSGTITLTPLSRLQQNGLSVEHPAAAGAADSPTAAALSSLRRHMQQNFGMLRWRDQAQQQQQFQPQEQQSQQQQQPAILQKSLMRFELNQFNLLQLSERCERRQSPSNYFERPLFDRPGRRPNSSSHPLLYLCSRCNCHGPASDFLAPRFCSISCVRRAHKRRQPSDGKVSRQEAKISNGYVAPQPQQPQQKQPQPQPEKQQQQQQKQQRDRERERERERERDKERERERERDRERERKLSNTKRAFRWTEYLRTKGIGAAAPIHLFLNPFPISANCFERGMKLEAIDPENCSLFCVCTIVEVRGYRLKLNFDGYASMYDFWVNADSLDIFPPGWCERTSRILQAPKGYCPDRFNWYRYLVKTNAKAAPIALFSHLNSPVLPTAVNGFQVGMHLEAEDLNDTGKICVATVADILDERIRVHFDGWDDCYDFWVHVNSPYIHPCSWHEGRQQLIVPPDYQNLVFNWSDYIADVGGVAAPVELFAPREPMEFQARMKLEVVDQRNPCLIRPATVITRKGYRVQLHLDCWPSEYYFWLEDDSPDLHPIGWCEATSHELETPPGYLQRPSPMPCDVDGCRGFGNAKRFNLNVHALRDCCPYAPENWRQWRAKTVKPPRVPPEHIKQLRPASKETSPLLLSRLQPSQVKPSQLQPAQLEPAQLEPAQLQPTQLKEEKTRLSLDSKPQPIQIKQEKERPMVQRETATVNPLCMSIAKPIVAEYGPQFARNYRLWQKNSDFDMSQLKSNPLYWTNWDVYEFVERALKSSSVAQLLFDEEIDGRALLMLGRRDLATYFKLKVGPTVKLFSLIVNLRIAVACKFKTTQTGLNFKRFKMSKTLPKEKREGCSRKSKSTEEEERCTAQQLMEEVEEMELGEELEEVEDDDDDVILDSDDFLSVKPSIATTMVKDTDVVMNALDALPPSVASIS